MAKDAAPEETTAPPPKKKKLLLIIIIAAVVVILAGTGAAVLLLSGKPAAEQQAEGEEEAAEEEEIAIYEKLETFTVNLADQESMLQVEITLKLASPEAQGKIKKRMPEVRDGLLRLLSSKTAEELATLEGKEELAGGVQKEVNSLIGAKKAAQGVQGVLFTSFIMQ